MRRLVFACLILVLAAGAGAGWHERTLAAAPEGAASVRVPAEAAPPLRLRELFEPGAKLSPSEKARALDGHSVRLVGFMAEMELPPRGAFYLVPTPLKCDEAGGGTADLPPEAVLVLVRSMIGKPIAWMGGPLEATGTFEVGNQVDDEGRVSNFRLQLEGPPAPSKANEEGPHAR